MAHKARGAGKLRGEHNLSEAAVKNLQEAAGLLAGTQQLGQRPRVT